MLPGTAATRAGLERAQSCFGKDSRPREIPPPQAWLEFDVDNVEQATAELESQGHPVTGDAGLRRRVEGAGPQRPAGPIGADDDARGRRLRADDREFAWRGRGKEAFACA